MRIAAIPFCFAFAFSALPQTQTTRPACGDLLQTIAPSTDAEECVLSIGDVIEILVLHDPGTQRPVAISKSGIVAVPLAGEVQAVNQTPAQLAARIATRLQPFLKDPKVTVRVTDNETQQRYFINGGVARQGRYPFASGMTILDANHSAGGCSLNHIDLRRRGTLHHLNYLRILDGSEVNMAIENGDHVSIW